MMERRAGQASFLQEHQSIVIYTPEKEISLRPLAAVCTELDGNRRMTNFSDKAAFQDYVQNMVGSESYREESELTRLEVDKVKKKMVRITAVLLVLSCIMAIPAFAGKWVGDTAPSHTRYEILLKRLSENPVMSMDQVRDALDSVSKSK